MWVYDPQAAGQAPKSAHPVQATAPIPQASGDRPVHSAFFSDEQSAGPEPPVSRPPAAPTAGKSRAPRHAPPAKQAQRPVIAGPLRLYLILYAGGLLAAGCLLQSASPFIRRFVQYYCGAWIGLLQAGQPLHLFSTLFLSGMLLLSLILLAGLCAFGAPLIYAQLLAAGLGNGLLALEFFLLYGWKGLLLYIPLAGITAAWLAQAMCALAQDAVQSAGALFRCCAFGAAGGTSASPLQSRPLIGRYLFSCTLLILFCGTSAVLAQWISRLL